MTKTTIIAFAIAVAWWLLSQIGEALIKPHLAPLGDISKQKGLLKALQRILPERLTLKSSFGIGLISIIASFLVTYYLVTQFARVGPLSRFDILRISLPVALLGFISLLRIMLEREMAAAEDSREQAQKLVDLQASVISLTGKVKDLEGKLKGR
jgi:hypothetical protein